MQQVLVKNSSGCPEMEKSLANVGKTKKAHTGCEKFSKNLWIFAGGCDSMMASAVKAHIVLSDESVKKFPQNVTFLGCHIAREML